MPNGGVPNKLSNQDTELTSERSFREPRWRGFDSKDFAPDRTHRFSAPLARHQPASGTPERATVKWFSPEKGFGFVTLADGSGDAFLHASVVERSGLDIAALQPGATVRVRTGHGLKGPQVSEILDIDTSTTAPTSQPKPVKRWADGPAAGRTPTRMTGTVKWYSKDKRFGFVAVDSGQREVFVHAAVLQQSAVAALSEGQRVEMDVAEGRKGLEAVSISLR
jgi:cold shock protein